MWLLVKRKMGKIYPQRKKKTSPSHLLDKTTMDSKRFINIEHAHMDGSMEKWIPFLTYTQSHTHLTHHKPPFILNFKFRFFSIFGWINGVSTFTRAFLLLPGAAILDDIHLATISMAMTVILIHIVMRKFSGGFLTDNRIHRRPRSMPDAPPAAGGRITRR